jgi:FMN phosphatase YigB (HAD superfamily)
MPHMDGDFDAVLLDWRGTLVATSTVDAWIREALGRLGRPGDGRAVDALAAALADAEATLDAPGVDCDAGLHHRTYRTAFGDLGIDDDLAAALYEVESDPSHDPFADDAAETLSRLRTAGLRIGMVSDIHVDIRPAFTAAGLGGLVDVFTLSFEQGIQKPDPQMFTRTLRALGVDASRALMVGDRSRADGAAVEAGIVTLLLPPLTDRADLRLHLITTLCGVDAGDAG